MRETHKMIWSCEKQPVETLVTGRLIRGPKLEKWTLKLVHWMGREKTKDIRRHRYKNILHLVVLLETCFLVDLV